MQDLTPDMPDRSDRRSSLGLLALGVVFALFLRKLWNEAPLVQDWQAEGPFHFFGFPWRRFDFPFWHSAGFFAFFFANRLARLLGVPIARAACARQDLIHLSLFLPVFLLVFWRPDFGLKIWMGSVYVLTLAFRVVGTGVLLSRSLPTRGGSAHAIVWLFFFVPTVLLTPWMSSVRWALGDEPSYLILSASLAKDGDSDIENNLAQEDYQDFTYKNDEGIGKMRGDAGRGHPRTYSMLLAPGYRLAGRWGVLAEQSVLAALAGLFIFLFLRNLSLSAPLALATASCISFAYPAFALAFFAYPETLAMMLTAGFLWVLTRRPSWGGGAGGMVFSGLLIALKARYAPASMVYYATLFIQYYRRPGHRLKALFLLLPLPAVAYGFWSALAPYRGGPGVWQGLKQSFLGLLPGSEGAWVERANYWWLSHPFYHDFWTHWLAQAHGLFLYAPIYLLAFAGVRAFHRERRGDSRLLAVLSIVPLAVLILRGSNTGWAPAGRFLVSLLPLAAPWLGYGLKSYWEAGRYVLPIVLAGWTIAVSIWVSVFPEICLPHYWDFGVTDIGCSNHLLGILDTLGFPLRLYRLWPGFCFVSELNLVFPLVFAVLAAWLLIKSPRPVLPISGSSWQRALFGALWFCAGVFVYVTVGQYLAGGEEKRYNLVARFKGESAAFRQGWDAERAEADRRQWAIRGQALNGPYLTLGPGRYAVRYGLLVESLNGCSINLKVVGRAEQLHAERTLCSEQLLRAGTDDPLRKVRDYYLEFTLDQEYREVEFRVYGAEGADFLVSRVELVPENTLPARFHYGVGRLDERLGLPRIALRRYLVAYEMGWRGDGIEDAIRSLLKRFPLSETEQAGTWQELDPDPYLFSFIKVDRVARRISAD